MRRRRYDLVVLIGIAAFSTLVTLAMVEGAARWFGPTFFIHSNMYREEPERGYALRPGFVGRGRLGEMIAIDERGLRSVPPGDTEPPLEAREELVGQAKALRVLAVGDSFQFGSGVPAEKAFPAALEAELVAGGHVATVWNAGVPGYNLFQAVRAIEYWLPRLRPDVVVLGVVENDVHNVDGPDHVARADGTLSRRVDAWHADADVNPFAALPGAWLQLQLRSAAFRWLSLVWIRRQLMLTGDGQLQALAAEVARSPALADRLLRGELGHDTRPRFERAAQLLGEANQVVADAGAQLVIVLFPRPEQLVEPKLRGGAARLAAAATAAGISVVDPAPLLASEENRVALFLFPNDHHPGARAYELMAAPVARTITTLLDPEADSPPIHRLPHGRVGRPEGPGGRFGVDG